MDSIQVIRCVVVSNGIPTGRYNPDAMPVVRNVVVGDGVTAGGEEANTYT